MNSAKASPYSIDLLRTAFYRCCHILGVSQETCLNLTLLMQSKEELETMIWAMAEQEKKGLNWGTTEVVLMAAKIHEKYLSLKRSDE